MGNIVDKDGKEIILTIKSGDSISLEYSDIGKWFVKD